jgi:hypothetical protein
MISHPPSAVGHVGSQTDRAIQFVPKLFTVQGRLVPSFTEGGHFHQADTSRPNTLRALLPAGCSVGESKNWPEEPTCYALAEPADDEQVAEILSRLLDPQALDDTTRDQGSRTEPDMFRSITVVQLGSVPEHPRYRASEVVTAIGWGGSFAETARSWDGRRRSTWTTTRCWNWPMKCGTG